MKKIGLGLVLGAFGLSNALNTPQDDGASILINWSNNKGEKKVFKIDDIERVNGNEKIHSKTLLQKYTRTCQPYKKGKCSISRSCSRGFSKKRSCSFEKSYSKDCKRDFSKKKYSSSICKPCKPHKVKKYRKPIIIEHRPVYKKHITYKPKKKQNKLHKKNYYNRSTEKCNSDEECYDKNNDTRIKKVSADDLAKLLKLKNDNKSNLDVKKSSASKLRKHDSVSKYLKDNANKYVKKNAERSCSNENARKFKYAKKDSDLHQKNKDAEKMNEKECRDSHNIVNLNNKRNEALLMKEQDKDNLHSNDRVVEEFDKLEHFKKVEERCRSASKARHAHVNKNECLDKNQKQKNGASNKEMRSNKRLRANKNLASNDFDMMDKNANNRASKYLKDENECEANRDNEKEFACSDSKETCDVDSFKCAEDKCDNFDLVNKKDKSSKDKKSVKCNDDENYLNKNKGKMSNRINMKNKLDSRYNDKGMCDDFDCDFDDFNKGGKCKPCDDVC